jgi:leucyl-tRNA synthetase
MPLRLSPALENDYPKNSDLFYSFWLLSIIRKQRIIMYNKNHKFYITTTLPYANAVPHVGHAIEFFQADAYARYFRKKLGKDNVFFNVGVDEHGLKVIYHGERKRNNTRKLSERAGTKMVGFL